MKLLRAFNPGALAVVVAFVLAISGSLAHAGCPDRRASCLLHEEGVQLLLGGKPREAAEKFAAAISAEPTARSYLGYAQAVESLGQIALAYDTMVKAQKLSQTELQANPGDVEVKDRAERIRYKLGELRAKIGFVWFRVPPNARARVVSIQREGESDLAEPLTQWTAVSPNRQTFIAKLDDGTKLTVVAEVAAGTQGTVVIPIPARAAIVPGPGPGPGPGPIGIGAFPAPKPAPSMNRVFALALSLLAPGPNVPRFGFNDRASSSTGLSVLYERRLGKSELGLTTRFEAARAGEATSSDGNRDEFVSGFELLALVGLRTMGSRTVHGRAGIGFSIYTLNSSLTTGPESFTRLYPTFELGGGLNAGRLRMQLGLLLSASGDAEVALGTRLMASVGFDLWRK